jgi:hypothetical protein
MAKVVRVSPEKRLSGLLNSNRPSETYKNRITGVPKHLCPACEELTAFSMGAYHYDAQYVLELED